MTTSCTVRGGVVLEDAGTLLPWGATLARLRALAAPTIEVRNQREATLSWGTRLILAGLTLPVRTLIDREDFDPARQWEPLSSVHGEVFHEWRPALARSAIYGEPLRRGEAAFALVARHLTAVFGSPTHAPATTFDIDGAAQWMNGEVEVRLKAQHSELNGQSVSICIATPGSRYYAAPANFRTRFPR